jgi:predicted secreted hydrolase
MTNVRPTIPSRVLRRRAPLAASARSTRVVSGALAGLLYIVLACGCGRGGGAGARATDGEIGVGAALGGAIDPGFERALVPRAFEFPRDHGPHPEFRSEWWYVTGNLESADGRRFGYQVTVFRNALRADPPERSAGPWSGGHTLWMAHFGLTDVAASRFVSGQRFARGGEVGVAGAQASPFRVWTYDLDLAAVESGDDAESRRHPFPLRIRASEPGRDGNPAVAIDLRLTHASGRPDDPVLQGEDGLSQKGAEAGNASYYYSFTRLATRGTVRVGDDEFVVSGASWLDREWSTSALGDGQIGWDWFALQFDDGRDLMWYRLRREDGSEDPHSAGTLVAPRAEATGRDVRRLRAGDVRLVAERSWTDPYGTEWPVAWNLELTGTAERLRVEAVLDEQLHEGSFRYWEGAVVVRGADGAVRGRGYLEMTGYGDGAAEPGTRAAPSGAREERDG